MIPSLLAREVRSAILDYLQTTLGLSDEAFERALFTFLGSERGLFRGPYVDVRLPFRRAGVEEPIPLELAPPFRPYAHQLAAFHRLHTAEGHQPQHTLITTGTGSGKTECFLYPILDHCLRHTGAPGVKAILLYPMNALASDQARRLAAELSSTPLAGKVTAGLYIGGEGTHGVLGPDHLIDQREILRQSPPDILLTNYKMLDFLLLRPEDRGLWAHNRPDTLRYLVLDELHTYDGAQGSDVACLIRRLRDRLEVPKWGFACVGTSATIAGRGRESASGILREFAKTVFGVTFEPQSVVSEDRESAREALGEDTPLHRVPEPHEVADLDPERHPDTAAYLRRQIELWTGELDLDPVALGARLRGHAFLRTLLAALDGEPRDYAHLERVLTRLEPAFFALPEAARPLALDSFLALVSHARSEVEVPGKGKRLEPFLTCQVQLWVRELRRLARRVPRSPADPIALGFQDDLAPEEPSDRYLPIAHCIECGGHGLAAAQREAESKLLDAPETIGRRWLVHHRECRYLVPNPPTDALGGLLSARLDPRTLELRFDAPSATTIPVLVAPTEVKKRFDGRCPECGADGSLGMLGSRAASLLSVAITQVFQSDHNEDRKMLAFVDSVQDAAHRAAFFGARTYRFNLRTAIQGALEAKGGPAVPLHDLAEQILTHASSTLSTAEVIAVLTPPDLRHLDEYESFQESGGQGAHKKLLGVLRRRLSWEATAEYGLEATRGRTLERTGCSVAYPASERLDRAALALARDLEETGLLSPRSKRPEALALPKIRHFLAGLLHRLRLRGGVFHALLDDYVKNGGRRIFLSKRKNPLLSPIPKDSTPRFLAAHEASGEFDTYTSAPGAEGWHRDFAARSFDLDRADEQVNELVGLALRRLGDAEVVAEVPAGKVRAFGLRAEALDVHALPHRVRCRVCARAISLPEPEVARWIGQVCPRFRCPGRLEADPRTGGSYYQRIYRSGRLRRIFAAEHTGLLGREAREALEARFKATADRAPDAPNLLVATPTLEMGIDVGDLSSVTLCAVPPATASYLQRVGRAGRKTGNAFTLTLALGLPKDLYFFTEPREMLAGDVLPPGAFLDAPYMLCRQLVAFAMDRWARQEQEVHNIPKEVRFVLGESGRLFPGRFLDHYAKESRAILEAFLALFKGELSEETIAKVREFAVELPERVREAFEAVRAERDDLGNLKKRLEARRQALEADPGLAAQPDDELLEIGESLKIVERVRSELLAKYPLNALTDQGVLPNYSFPEPGVTLRSVIRRNGKPRREAGDEQARYEAIEYQRPASTAIRELAPWNRFYAEGRRVEIDEVDLGNKARPLLERWRFCPSCHHTERLLDGRGDHALECPRCRAPGWGDQGQVHSMVHLRRVRSFSDKLGSVATDDRDDRESKSYEVLDLIDVGRENWREAQVISSLPFGVEFLRDVALREVNFGFADGAAVGARLEVAGQRVQEHGFRVCSDCGRVKDPRKEDINHTPFCRFRKAPNVEERAHEVFLYRQVVSEAIRVLLPVSTVEVETSRASFKAALELGFRLRFRGNPQHLLVRSVSEPLSPEGTDRRHFLVVYDSVPGGTGYLPGLWKQGEGSGMGLVGVLELAYEKMRACECRRQPDRDGCHRCLLAYQAQRDLPNVSRAKALELLRPILERRGEMKSVPTLSEVSLDDRLESELELKFRDALRSLALSRSDLEWEETIYLGRLAWRLKFANGPTWQLEAQVNLGHGQGVEIPSRPDFLLRPIAGAPGAKPVAVFCDGHAFHVQPSAPRSRIWDDVEKRRAIIDSGRYLAWSLTWRDLEELGGRSSPPTLFRGLEPAKVRLVLQQLGSDLPADLAHSNPFSLLLAYLESPTAAWDRVASGLVAASILQAPAPRLSPGALNALELRVCHHPERFATLPAEAHVGPGLPPVLGVVASLPWAMFFARAPLARLQAGAYAESRAYLRLFDEAGGRRDPDFTGSWRAFLAAWNWLQFHPALEVLTSEQLGLEGVAQVAEPIASEYEYARIVDRPESRSLLSLVPNEPCRRIAAECLERGGPAPEPGYEVLVDGRILGDAELAWPKLRVAVVTEGQAEVARTLKAEGWRVFESSAAAADVVAALTSEGGGP